MLVVSAISTSYLPFSKHPPTSVVLITCCILCSTASKQKPNFRLHFASVGGSILSSPSFRISEKHLTLRPRLAPSGRVITNPIAASVAVSLGYRSTSMALGKNRRGFVAVSPRGLSTFYRRIRDHFNCVQMPINGSSICGVLYRSTQQTNGLSRGRKCLSLGRRDDFTVYERFSSSFSSHRA